MSSEEDGHQSIPFAVCINQHERHFDLFSYSVHEFVYTYYWLKATNTGIVIGIQPIYQTSFLETKNFSFFDDTNNGPAITISLPLNHRIDFCVGWES